VLDRFTTMLNELRTSSISFPSFVNPRMVEFTQCMQKAKALFKQVFAVPDVHLVSVMVVNPLEANINDQDAFQKHSDNGDMLRLTIHELFER